MFRFQCIKIEDHDWNKYNFSCANCNECLDDDRYITRESQAFCLNCFATMYLNYCDTCCEHIEINQTKITRQSHQWHATQTCFCCYTCLIPLNNNNNDFLQDDGALFCSNECASKINNHPIDVQLILQNIIRQHPDIPTSYIHKNKSPAFVQHQTLFGFSCSKEQKRKIIKIHSRKSIKFDNHLNLEQTDCDCVSAELLRCSTSSFTLLPYFTNCLRSFSSSGVMFLISRPKSRITSQFPCSSSLNELSRFTKKHCVHFVSDDNQDVNGTNIPDKKMTKTTKSNKNNNERRKKSSIFGFSFFCLY
ncbi:unnamed protein product [Adineta steineri]|uniref:LIM zinc-binding domain-containing protein n=1 Tax=Adineta steineri TaxID=433720 RepID=A0A813NLE9_9BILA|nr:unnamed protein product [Adineta steineri]